MSELLTKSEVAQLLGGTQPASVSYVDQLLAKKKLPRVRLSYKMTRIPRQPSRSLYGAGRSTPDERRGSSTERKAMH